jgi:hypothetical protein
MAITSPTQEPTGNYMSVDHWERSLDPWHADAFPAEFKHAGTGGARKSGWMGVDWCGNPIVFVPDGTEA